MYMVMLEYFFILEKRRIIELVYRSPQAFYTLTGVKFEKGMTPNYRGVVIKHNQEICVKFLK